MCGRGLNPEGGNICLMKVSLSSSQFLCIFCLKPALYWSISITRSLGDIHSPPPNSETTGPIFEIQTPSDIPGTLVEGK